MNLPKLAIAALVCGGCGAVIGWATATIAPTPYISGVYRDQTAKYLAIGAVGGVLGGVSLELVRQLKESQDRSGA